MCTALVTLSRLSRTVSCTWISKPKPDVWLTLASATNQSTLCVAMTTPSDPFWTCLVGIPLTEHGWDQLYNQTITRNCTDPGRCEPLWWCLGTWRCSTGQPAGRYQSNDSGNGMNKVGDFLALHYSLRNLKYWAPYKLLYVFLLTTVVAWT